MERIEDVIKRYHPGITGAALPPEQYKQEEDFRNRRACNLLTDLGYRYDGVKWTDEPTAEQRLEAVRHAVSDWRHSNPMMVIQYLVEILSDTWRPGKTEGK